MDIEQDWAGAIFNIPASRRALQISEYMVSILFYEFEWCSGHYHKVVNHVWSQH